MNDELLARLAALEFPTSRLREGYERTDVDAYRTELGERLAADEDIGDYLPSRFRKVARGQGYAVWQVDLAFKDVHRLARAGPVGMLVEQARFTPRRTGGYDMGDVDVLLDELVAAAARGEPLAPLVLGRRLGTKLLGEGYDKSEVDALLDRIVGERG